MVGARRRPWRLTGFWMRISMRAIGGRRSAICRPGCCRAGLPGASRIVSALVFLLAAQAIGNPLCFRLAPVALRSCFSIRSRKRFTHLFPSGARLLLGHGAGGSVDCHARIARPANPVAHRCRNVLDRRIRHHLRLPGLRVRLCAKACTAFPSDSGIARRCWWPACCTLLMIVCLLVLVYAVSAWRIEPGGSCFHCCAC